MEKIKSFINNRNVFLLSMLLYCCSTIPTLINHYPWFDEFHALYITQNMTLDNFVRILKEEGHFALWYLLILPIAKFKASYYLMLIINWIFYTAALVVMWKKAEFNNVIKCIITFSWISLNYFPIVARCYSIGILGLFIVLSLYKKQLEKPIAYATALGLTAHTAFLNTIPLVPLGCIFMYKLIKNRNNLPKKDICISFLILFIASILWVYPFLNGYGSEGMLASNGAKYSLWHSLGVMCEPLLVYMYIAAFGMLFAKAKNEVKFFIVTTLGIMTWFYSFIYNLYPHHMLYFYVFFIAWLWLIPSRQELTKKNILFVIIMFTIFFWNFNNLLAYALNVPNKTSIINYLNSLNDKQYLYVDMDDTDVAFYCGGKEGYKTKIIYGDNDCVNSLSCVQQKINEDKDTFEKPWSVRVLSSQEVGKKGNKKILDFHITEFKWY